MAGLLVDGISLYASQEALSASVRAQDTCQQPQEVLSSQSVLEAANRAGQNILKLVPQAWLADEYEQDEGNVCIVQLRYIPPKNTLHFSVLDVRAGTVLFDSQQSLDNNLVKVIISDLMICHEAGILMCASMILSSL